MAVPSFGQACSVCDVGGFGPSLTPFGRAFKLGGYTNTFANSGVPISAMAIASYLRTATGQPNPPAPHYSTNDNFALDEASLFLGGGIGNNFGGIVHVSYEGADRAFAWDDLDLRAVTTTTIADSNVILGLSLNNNPTTQDAWNSLPARGFPYTESELAPTPDTATLISGALAQNVLGLSVYAWWDSTIYTEAGLYRSLGRRFLSAVGVDPDETSLIDGVAPYLRIAYERNIDNQNFQLGAFSLMTDLYPSRDKSADTTDAYTDLGLDASYELVVGQNVYTLIARYTYERQRLGATQALGGAADAHGTLQDVHIEAHYHWRNLIGATISGFRRWGSRDTLLYADNRTFRPDSSGFIFQIDGSPFGDSVTGGRFNVRVGAQYTLYTRFNGAGRNYDGSGRDASDNNTLRVFVWAII